MLLLSTNFLSFQIASQEEQPLTGYHVYLSPSPPPTTTPSFPVTLPLQNPAVTIDGLDTFTQYLVTVAVFNGAGEGPHTSQSITTLEESEWGLHVHVHGIVW